MEKPEHPSLHAWLMPHPGEIGRQFPINYDSFQTKRMKATLIFFFAVYTPFFLGMMLLGLSGIYHSQGVGDMVGGAIALLFLTAMTYFITGFFLNRVTINIDNGIVTYKSWKPFRKSKHWVEPINHFKHLMYDRFVSIDSATRPTYRIFLVHPTPEKSLTIWKSYDSDEEEMKSIATEYSNLLGVKVLE
jgi:hypothetical protein